jgi:zinc transport system substrate-binding protein
MHTWVADVKLKPVLAILLVVAIAAAAAAVLVPSLTTVPESKEASVAVTWGLLAEVVYRLTDGDVGIYQVLPPGAELHDWEPTPEALRTVQRSRMLVYLLEDLDGWGVGLARSAGVKAVKAGENLPMLIEVGEHGHTHGDVHVWLSPTNMVKIVENVAAALIQEFPEIGVKVMRNRDDYVAEIKRLDNELKTVLEPYRGRVFITQHDAFRYFAEHYGLRVLAVLGAEEEEPSAAHLAEVVETIKKEGLKVVYAEEGFTHPVLNTLARDTGVKIGRLNTMEGLTLDDVRRGEGYVNVMRRNGMALVEGFG